MTLSCAVLDDYQNVATTVADWSPLSDRVEVVSFTDHFRSEDDLADASGVRRTHLGRAPGDRRRGNRDGAGGGSTLPEP